MMDLPPEYLAKLRVLPSRPMRVRIKKAAVKGDLVEWLTAFLQEIHKEKSGSHPAL